MAASSVQPDHHRGDATGHRPRSMKNRRPLLSHLNVQVPAVGNASIFHPSPKSASSVAHTNTHAHAHGPASPSLLRSPSAWIRASFGPGKHTPRPPKNFCYDARSYAQNFDEGGGEEDALKYRCFSPRLPTSPQSASQSAPVVDTSGSDGHGKETAACETGIDSD